MIGDYLHTDVFSQFQPHFIGIKLDHFIIKYFQQNGKHYSIISVGISVGKYSDK